MRVAVEKLCLNTTISYLKYGVVLHRQKLYHLYLMRTHLLKNKNHRQVKVQLHQQLICHHHQYILNSTSSNDGSLVEYLCTNVYTDSIIEKEPI